MWMDSVAVLSMLVCCDHMLNASIMLKRKLQNVTAALLLTLLYTGNPLLAWGHHPLSACVSATESDKDQ